MNFTIRKQILKERINPKSDIPDGIYLITCNWDASLDKDIGLAVKGHMSYAPSFDYFTPFAWSNLDTLDITMEKIF